ncbi:MAG: hypothetical protein KatS3mg054_0961 [Chloroflexus sp.]|nr:MAG: hypothetical protein KatS3mg054_0961 [Chloroflexus sp.]
MLIKNFCQPNTFLNLQQFLPYAQECLLAATCNSAPVTTKGRAALKSCAMVRGSYSAPTGQFGRIDHGYYISYRASLLMDSSLFISPVMGSSSLQGVDFPPGLVITYDTITGGARKVTDVQPAPDPRHRPHTVRSSQMVRPDGRALYARHPCRLRGKRCDPHQIVSTVGAAAWLPHSKPRITDNPIWQRYPRRNVRPLRLKQEHCVICFRAWV